MKKGWFYFLILVIALPMGILKAQNKITYKIIVTVSTPDSSITKKMLSNIFLKKSRKWKNGRKILPVDLDESSMIRKNFSLKIHKKKVSAIKAYWQKQIFTGRGVPPPEKVSDKEILKYVQDHQGAIGYISLSTSIKNFKVKVIKITKK